MARKYITFESLKEVLVQVRTSKFSRPPPSTHTKWFRLLRPRDSFLWATSHKSVSSILALSSDRRRPETEGISPCPPRWRTTLSKARLGANIIPDDCTPHRVQKDSKPSTKLMSVDDEHFHTCQVSHFVSWADVFLCHRGHR